VIAGVPYFGIWSAGEFFAMARSDEVDIDAERMRGPQTAHD